MDDAVAVNESIMTMKTFHEQHEELIKEKTRITHMLVAVVKHVREHFDLSDMLHDIPWHNTEVSQKEFIDWWRDYELAEKTAREKKAMLRNHLLITARAKLSDEEMAALRTAIARGEMDAIK